MLLKNRAYPKTNFHIIDHQEYVGYLDLGINTIEQ